MPSRRKTVLTLALVFSFLTSPLSALPVNAQQYINLSAPIISPQSMEIGAQANITVSATATSVYGIKYGGVILRNTRGSQVASKPLVHYSGDQWGAVIDVSKLPVGTYSVVAQMTNSRYQSKTSSSAFQVKENPLASICKQGSIPDKTCRSNMDCTGSAYTSSCQPPSDPRKGGRYNTWYCGKKDFFALCNVKRPTPPSATLQITNPFPERIADNGVGVAYETIKLASGNSATIQWSSKNVDECLFEKRYLRNGAWVLSPIDAREFSFLGRITDPSQRKGSAKITPIGTVEYRLSCWGPNGRASQSVRAIEVPGLPTFSGFTNTTGVLPKDKPQIFHVTVSGDASIQITLDAACSRKGTIRAVSDPSNTQFKKKYAITLTPNSGRVDCTVTARSVKYGQVATHPLMIQAYEIYPAPQISFAPYPGDVWAISGSANGNVSITQGEKVNLSWSIYLDQPGVSVSLNADTTELFHGGDETKKFLSGNKDVAPTQTTTYTLTATNRYGATQSVKRTVFVATKTQQYRADICNIPDPQCVEKNILENKSKLPTRQQSGGLVVGIPAGLAAAGTCAVTIGPGCVGFGAAIGGGVLSWLTAPVAGLACALGCGAAGGYVGYQAGSAIGSSSAFEPDPKKGCPLTCPLGYKEITATPTLNPDNYGGLSSNMPTKSIWQAGYELVDMIQVPIQDTFPAYDDEYDRMFDKWDNTSSRDMLSDEFASEDELPIPLCPLSGYSVQKAPTAAAKGTQKDPIVCVPEDKATKTDVGVYKQGMGAPWAGTELNRYANGKVQKCVKTGAYTQRTIATSGCGVASLAMVAEYWRKTIGTKQGDRDKITPVHSAKWITEQNGYVCDEGTDYSIYKNASLLSNVGISIGGAVMKSSTIFTNDLNHRILKKEGKKAAYNELDQRTADAKSTIIGYLTQTPPVPVIAGTLGFGPINKEGPCRLGPNSPFTNVGHYLVLTGYKKITDHEGTAVDMFTISDSISDSYCFYMGSNTKKVYKAYGEAPANLVMKLLKNATVIAPSDKIK